MPHRPKTENTEPRPADVAQEDSLGLLARRLLDPAHLADLARRSAATVRERGAQQLWRDAVFRLQLACHYDSWRHRADLPLRRDLKAQRARPLAGGPRISVVVPVYNTPLPFFKQMVNSVRRQTYGNWQLVLVDASDAAHPAPGALAQKWAAKDPRLLYQKIENGGIAANTTAGFRLAAGDYLALLDHDDLLYPNALYECAQTIQNTGADFVYSDEIILSADLKKAGGYHFKPDFAPDTLRGSNYICHLTVFSRPLLEAAGACEDPAFDGAQDHDLVLRLTEKARRIEHIKKVLYIWREHAGSTAAGMAAKPYALAAGARAVEAQLRRLGMPGSVSAVEGAPGAFHIRYELTAHPLVSVLIPNKDHTDDLERCLSSLYKNAGYDNMEVLVLENNSTQPATEAYYAALPARYPRCRVLRYRGTFNFSAINNFGARQANGEHLLLLNNDIELLSPGFVRELLSYSQRADVGAVGAKLYYPDDTIQHAGVIMGINGSAGHSHKGYPRDAVGDLYRLVTAQNYMAVTGACLMTKASLYRAAGGLDEQSFAVAYNDVDYCLKLWQQGLHNVFTPCAEAYHYESKSRGLDDDPKNAARYQREKAAFYAKYKQYIDNYDPYYNPHFDNRFENFGLIC